MQFSCQHCIENSTMLKNHKFKLLISNSKSTLLIYQLHSLMKVLYYFAGVFVVRFDSHKQSGVGATGISGFSNDSQI